MVLPEAQTDGTLALGIANMSSNRLCRAIVNNPNSQSPISYFELVTVREYSEPNGGTYIDEISTAAEYLDNTNAYDDPFYRIMGIYKNTIPKKRRFIADFFSLDEAKKFLSDITGESIDIICY